MPRGPDGAFQEDALHEDAHHDEADSDEAFYRAAHAAQIKAHRRRLKSRPPVPAARANELRRSPSQQAGDTAEDTALRHLERAGLVAVARNLSCRAGEVDLIMRDGAVLVFVEVRSRRDARYGGAAASVGHAKQQRLLRAARYFLHTQWRGAWPRCRFDVVAFDDGALQWIRSAFTE